MKNPERKPYVWAMVAGCGAIALGVLLAGAIVTLVASLGIEALSFLLG